MTDPLIYRLLAIVALVGATAFIAAFSREPWRRHQFGRSLMAMAAGIWVFALTATLNIWLDYDYPLRQEMRIVAYTAINYAIWSRLFVLLQLQRRDRVK